MSMLLVEKHFQAFQESLNDNISIWNGSRPFAWYKWILDSEINMSQQLSNEIRSRSDIIDMVANSEIDTASCCISILAS
jgi:hypothetical protein